MLEDVGRRRPRLLRREMLVDVIGLPVFSFVVLLTLLVLVRVAAGIVRPFLAGLTEATQRNIQALALTWPATLIIVPFAMRRPRLQRLHKLRKAAIWGAYAFVALWVLLLFIVGP